SLMHFPYFFRVNPWANIYSSTSSSIPHIRLFFPLMQQEFEETVVPQPMEVKDIMKEDILPWLPAKALTRFKSVSKGWNFWIKSPVMAHRQSYTHKSILGFFCQANYSHEPDFFTFDQASCGVPDPSLSFLPVSTYVAGSTHGLLVCRTHSEPDQYYVCNPATRTFRKLPSPGLYHGLDSACILAFDPALTNIESYYQLVCAVPLVGQPEGTLEAVDHLIYGGRQQRRRLWGERFRRKVHVAPSFPDHFTLVSAGTLSQCHLALRIILATKLDQSLGRASREALGRRMVERSFVWGLGFGRGIGFRRFVRGFGRSGIFGIESSMVGFLVAVVDLLAVVSFLVAAVGFLLAVIGFGGGRGLVGRGKSKCVLGSFAGRRRRSLALLRLLLLLRPWRRRRWQRGPLRRALSGSSAGVFWSRFCWKKSLKHQAEKNKEKWLKREQKWVEKKITSSTSGSSNSPRAGRRRWRGILSMVSPELSEATRAVKTMVGTVSPGRRIERGTTS
ncbi:F-box protein, partial [Striga hermonthica]